jgi:hypothetical protein
VSENEVENLKLSAGASKAPVGIVPMHPLYGMARVLEDSAVKYAPYNYMALPLKDALASYDSALLRHRISCTKLGGEVTPESYASLDPDSGLPHIFHILDGLMILATLMIRDGVLPLDPGQGKRKIASLADALEKRVRQTIKVVPSVATPQTVEIENCPIPNCSACKRVQELDGKPNVKGVDQ